MKYAVPLAGAAAAAAALTACGSSHHSSGPRLPSARLVVPGRSIGPVRLDEPRTVVRRTLGPGKQSRRGIVEYFDGRLLVDYWFHDGLTNRVEYLKTTWPVFHTRSGVHVGGARSALHLPRGSCSGGVCSVAANKGPDAPGTGFGIRAGKIAWIAVGYG
ncbi:MAG: hypothetical protein ACJ75L_00070 [Gaiellaceae bacterium]